MSFGYLFPFFVFGSANYLLLNLIKFFRLIIKGDRGGVGERGFDMEMYGLHIQYDNYI